MPRQRLYVLLLVVATLLAMGRACKHEFVTWDDIFNIYNNQQFNPPSVGGILYYWAHPNAGLYIPVTYTAWGLLAFPAQLDQADAMGATLNPWIYHTANVLMHLLCVWVVFKILILLIRDDRAAVLGALLFALHPVQVEAVAWAAGLKDVLAGLFSLIAIWQYIEFAKSPPRNRRDGAYVIGTICLILAMLAKPSAMVVPVIALVLDVWIIGRSWRQAAEWLWPWLGLSFACMISAKLIQPGTNVPITPIWARPLVAGNALAFYLYKLVWPIHLCIDYGRRPAEVMPHAWFYFTWMIPATVGAVLWWRRKQAAWLLAAGLVFVIGVLPMLGFTRFMFQYYSTVADHYLYLSMLGPAMALAWTATKLPGKVFTVAAGLWLGMLGVRSSLQCRYWSDSLSLFQHGVEVSPDSFGLHNNLGAIYKDHQRAEEAIVQFRQSLRLNDQFLVPRENLAGLLSEQGRWAEAEQEVRKIIELRAAQPLELLTKDRVIEDYNDLGKVLLAEGKYAEAIQTFQAVLRADPQHAEAAKSLENAIRLEQAPPTTAPVRTQIRPLS